MLNKEELVKILSDNDEKNNKLFLKYKELVKKEKNVIFGGRLGNYKYYNMDQVIEEALKRRLNLFLSCLK